MHNHELISPLNNPTAVLTHLERSRSHFPRVPMKPGLECKRSDSSPELSTAQRRSLHSKMHSPCRPKTATEVKGMSRQHDP